MFSCGSALFIWRSGIISYLLLLREEDVKKVLARSRKCIYVEIKRYYFQRPPGRKPAGKDLLALLSGENFLYNFGGFSGISMCFLCVFSCGKRAPPEPIGYLVQRLVAPINGRKYMGFLGVLSPLVPYLHSRKLTWYLKITQMKRKFIFQTSNFWDSCYFFLLGYISGFQAPSNV